MLPERAGRSNLGVKWQFTGKVLKYQTGGSGCWPGWFRITKQEGVAVVRAGFEIPNRREIAVVRAVFELPNRRVLEGGKRYGEKVCRQAM
jgi:hypothetical protein